MFLDIGKWTIKVKNKFLIVILSSQALNGRQIDIYNRKRVDYVLNWDVQDISRVGEPKMVIRVESKFLRKL